MSLEAGACGWAGDGELKYDSLLPGIAPSGRQIPQTLDRESTRLPGGLGFGMVVVEPGNAVPYLQSTYGRPITSFEDLQAFGVTTIVDLGHDGEISAAKSLDGNSQSRGYFNIPVESPAPGIDQIEFFHGLLLDADNRPLLVVAPSAEILAVTWAAYRLQLGAPLDYAIYEAKSIGLRSEQESTLLGWQQN